MVKVKQRDKVNKTFPLKKYEIKMLNRCLMPVTPNRPLFRQNAA